MSDELALVLFDCDGTLVDGLHAVLSGMHAAFDAHEVPRVSDATIRSGIGLSLTVLVPQLLPEERRGEAGELIATFKNIFRANREAGQKVDPFYEGAQDCVRSLIDVDHFLLGIATGKGMPAVELMLEQEGWEPHFHTIQTADNAPSKPHPGMIEQALSETGVDKRRCVMIGDTSFDMQMAGSAGVHAIGVGWGYHEHEFLMDHGAKSVVGTFEELNREIAKVLG